MQIILANTAGFCRGVRRAMDKTLKLIRKKNGFPLYTYGPLIHNPQVIRLLEEENVKVINSIEEAQKQEKGTIIIRAHGVPPDERQALKKMGHSVVDATCVDVLKVQAIVKKYSLKGYQIIIVGDKGHAEVNGLVGFSGGKAVVVSNLEEAKTVKYVDKICIVAQTTQERKVFHKVVEYIKNNTKADIKVFNTICSSTWMRQSETLKIAQRVDVMVVVGGKNSANTNRLAELIRQNGKTVYHIESEKELENIDFSGVSKVGVTAGASTPNWIIRKVIKKLREKGNNRKTGFLDKIKSFANIVSYTNIFLALGAAILYAGIMKSTETQINIGNFAMVFFYILSMHCINNYLELNKTNILEPEKKLFREDHSAYFLWTGIIGAAIANIIALHFGLKVFFIVFALSVLGVFYSRDILPKGLRFHNVRKLRDLPGSKEIFTAIGWGMVLSVVPFIEKNEMGFKMLLSFLLVFLFIFYRTLIIDIKDSESDSILGNETFFTYLGREKVYLISSALKILFLIVSFLGYFSGIFCIKCILVFLASLLYLNFLEKQASNETLIKGINMEIAIDLSMYISGLTLVL